MFLHENQITQHEKAKISQEIKDELIDHWFKAASMGVALAFCAAGSFFIFFYDAKILTPLIVWSVGLSFTLILIAVLNFFYNRQRSKFSTQTWNVTLSCLVLVTTIFWGSTILFAPQDIIQQFILLVILFIAAASFSLITVGMFVVSVISACFILLPVAAWFFTADNFYYDIGGVFVLIYILFLSGMNFRSTKWLIHSLELSKMLASFTHQANYDLLTDLPNQRLLVQYIEEAVSSAIANQENFVLIGFAINRLEVFNNSLGYQAGDLVITSVAKRLESQILALNRVKKKERILTRPRSDAFVIMITPFEAADIHEEVNQLLEALNEPFHLENKESRLTASIGITIFPKDSESSEKLLSNTYAAMFEAKSKGGNQIEFYKTTLTSSAPRLLKLENDLHYALENQELEVYYQPVVDLQEGIINGMEALIRWNHPQQGLVFPLDFISIAEETGLIIPMSEWILEQAAFQTQKWNQEGYEFLKVSVNLSPRQLTQSNLITTFDRILEKTKLKTQNLELELSETAILNESHSSLISAISERGIALSIDDFGTGYSGLSYLTHFRIDKIKIDKSFINDITHNSDTAAIVTAMLAMAKELGIKTVAEGVETKEQLEFLRKRGCQYIQGYYFGRPVSALAFEDLLKQGIAEKL